LTKFSNTYTKSVLQAETLVDHRAGFGLIETPTFLAYTTINTSKLPNMDVFVDEAIAMRRRTDGVSDSVEKAYPTLLTKYTPSDKGSTVPASTLHSVFDINFLRKEKMYTKLKYSRCPQYDIVSGGLAVLSAAFIGFLISEKFGIELVDSGDFYIAFMYGVFISFAVRPLVRISSSVTSASSPLSLRFGLDFFSGCLVMVVKGFRRLAS
jgi:hypothetical protein